MQKIMLIILGFSLVVLQTSCNLFKKDEAKTENTDTSDDTTTEDDYNIDDYADLETSEDDFDEEDLADLLEEDSGTGTESDVDETAGQPATSEPNEYTEASTDRSFEETPPVSTGGDYLVVAGNFSSEENAQRLVDKLVGFGYSGAEIVYFKSREFHTVCAGKYDSRSQASAVAKDLKENHEIETYVHKKR